MVRCGPQVLPPARATAPPWLPAKSARVSNLPACCALGPPACAAPCSCHHEPCSARSPNATPGQQLEALNANAHRLDPQAQAQLRQINAMRQMQMNPSGVGTGHAGSYPWQAGMTQAAEAASAPSRASAQEGYGGTYGGRGSGQGRKGKGKLQRARVPQAPRVPRSHIKVNRKRRGFSDHRGG